MHFSVLVTLVAAAALPASAFPGFVAKDWPAYHDLGERSEALYERTVTPYSPQFPYTGAKLDGQRGTGVGGIPVPAPGDTEHYYQPPPTGSQRGPCPGLNALANHGFLSRDGVTNFTELVAAMQNVYNVDYNLSVTLSVLGISYDGDPTTERLSIGGDATAQTSLPGYFFGPEGGLSRHNTFESDASLTRDDYYLHGDDYSFNGTLFQMMKDTVSSTSSSENPLFDFNGMALYRSQRYAQSRAENPMFWFPDQVLHSYGAATFLFEAFPSSSNNNLPDLPTIATFFGAVPHPNGTYTHQPERIPTNWTNRVTPYTLDDLSNQTLSLYHAYTMPFGGNNGVAGNWVNDSTAYSSAGGPTSGSSNFACGVYNDAIAITDSSPQPLALLRFITTKLNPIFAPYNCSLVTSGIP